MQDDTFGFCPLVVETCVRGCKPAAGDINDLQLVTLEPCVFRKYHSGHSESVTDRTALVGRFENEFSFSLWVLSYIKPFSFLILSADKGDGPK